MKALDTRFYVKFMQLEIGLLYKMIGIMMKPFYDVYRFTFLRFLLFHS